MELSTVWFIVVAALWTGYLVLEGFDFGVGALLPIASRREADRRELIGSIGPFWDGNEVWLISAVGVMFAAFPDWYASALSGFYPLLLTILVTLIVRGVAFEFRGKVAARRWKSGWDTAIFLGSAVPAYAWGVLFANLVGGLPMDANHVVRASLADIFGPYALLGGLVTLSLCVLHGGVFLTMKTTGELRLRCHRAAMAAGVIAIPAQAVFGTWTWQQYGGIGTVAATGVLVTMTAAGLALTALRRPGWSFAATAGSAATLIVLVFSTMWPNVLPSTIDPAFNLTATNAAASGYALTLLSWASVVLIPLVLAYQAWSYWVFRNRLIRPVPPTGPRV